MILFGARDIVKLVANQTVNGYRFAQGNYDQNGEWVTGQKSDISFLASVQKPKDHDLEILPVGKRDRDTIKLYTEYRLNLARRETKIASDVLIWDGSEYEVTAIIDWNHVSGHYEVLATKVI